jgi:hypothetical protein
MVLLPDLDQLWTTMRHYADLRQHYKVLHRLGTERHGTKKYRRYSMSLWLYSHLCRPTVELCTPLRFC